MRKLSEFFGKDLNQAQSGIWFERVKNLTPEVFDLSVSACIDAEKFFPTPKIFLEKSVVVREDISRNSIRKENILSAKTLVNLQNPKEKNSAFEKSAMALLRRVMLDGLTGQALASAMVDMEDDLPGRGYLATSNEILEELKTRQNSL